MKTTTKKTAKYAINPAFISMSDRELSDELKKTRDEIRKITQTNEYYNNPVETRPRLELLVAYRNQLEIYLEIPF